ncbi:mechanosensitive ion channel family protein [Salmonirosea aquatica]|uniref:mechanosensitive ion channel family protein n=1 Tax=Salmonirosea aquatica TaxID=2654236 RepID=UPI003570F029
MSRFVFRWVRKESHEEVPWTEFLRLLRPPLEVFIMLLALYLASKSLEVPGAWGTPSDGALDFRVLIEKVYFSAFLLALTWLGIRFIKCMGLLFKLKAQKTASKLDDQLVPFFRDLVIMLFVIGMVFIALGRVFSVDVLTLVTSLGIGGLAIALAARETLENLFASFALMIDRPFTVGDSINVGGTEGTIVKLGFRSTRLQTFDGSLVTLPNRLLTSQSLENLSERRQRRARFVVRLAYDTPGPTVKAIVETIQQHIDQNPETNEEPGVIRFDAFGESSLDVLVIFYVQTAIAREFNRVKEEVNLKILEIVKDSGGRFAFPSRELYIRQESSSALPESETT